MADLPNYAVVFNAQLVASSTVAIGNVIIRSASVSGRFAVATAAERGTRRSEGIATTAYGGTGTGSIQYQQTGTISAAVSGLAAGSASWVRCSATGTIERCTPSGSDDVIGYAEADGSVHLAFGLFNASNYAGGGGGATPGGSNGQVQYNNAGAFGGIPIGSNGQVLGVAAGVNAYLDAVQVPAGTAGQVVALDGSGGLAAVTNGSNGDVLTMVAGVPAFSAAAASGAPTNASYVTIALNASLSAERVLAATAPVTITDGGANGNVTIAWTAPTGTGVMFATTGAMNAAAKTSLDISSDVAVTYSGAVSGGILVHNGTKYVNTAKGSNSTVLTTSSGGTVTWAQVTTAMISPGSNGQFLETAGGVATWGNVATFFGSTGTNASVGTFRDQNTGSYVFRNAANSADQYGLSFSSSNILAVGSDSAYSTGTMVSALRVCATASIDPVINGSFVGSWTGSVLEDRVALSVAGTVGGFSSLSASFHWASASISVSGTSVTLTAAQYACPVLEFTGGTAAFEVVAPNTSGTPYFVYNRTASAFTCTFRKTSGSGGIAISGFNGMHVINHVNQSGTQDYVTMSPTVTR